MELLFFLATPFPKARPSSPKLRISFPVLFVNLNPDPSLN
jgi:hypothetical protein